MNKIHMEIEDWLKDWNVDPCGAKLAFNSFYTWLKNQENITFEFKARAGISYSLRAIHAKDENRPLFALIDVVDDDAEERWLSVCFYADMVNDPDELGDFVPKGLLGSDALCLNLEEKDENMVTYIQKRLEEAYNSSLK